MAPASLPTPLSLGADLIHLCFINRLKKKKTPQLPPHCFLGGLGKLEEGRSRLQVPSWGLKILPHP